MKKANLIDLKLAHPDKLEQEKHILSSWNVKDIHVKLDANYPKPYKDDLIKVKHFYHPEEIKFAIGSFEVLILNTPQNIRTEEYIDKVVLRYEKCNLTIELYTNYTLVSTHEVNNTAVINEKNIKIHVSIF